MRDDLQSAVEGRPIWKEYSARARRSERLLYNLSCVLYCAEKLLCGLGLGFLLSRLLMWQHGLI